MSSFASSSAGRLARSQAPIRPSPVALSANAVRPQLAQVGQFQEQRRIISANAASQEVSADVAVIPEEKLIEMTKNFVAGGFGAANQPEMLSDDMIFRGPVVGPLPKNQYLAAITGFKVAEAFPDIETKGFGYSIDPTDPFRVWFFTQTTGTHAGDFQFGGTTIPPTGGKIQNGTEANSIIWTPDGKVKYISVGYCVDRINSNTPDGTMKVAVVGFLRATGKGELWNVLSNPIIQWGIDVANKLQGKPSNSVPFEDLPEWWKKLPDANLRGAENYTK